MSISLNMGNQIDATAFPNIQDVYGYILIGSFLSSAVWGVSCLQLFIFYMNSEHDSAFLKAVLAFLWVFDTVNEILILKSNWPALILQYGNIENVVQIQPELVHHIWVEFTMAVIVQFYFIRRIYKFSMTVFRGIKSKLMLGALALLSLLVIAQIVFMIVYIAYSYGQPVAVLGQSRQVGFNITNRGVSAFVDLCIAVAMVYLIQRKSHFGRRMISRLMVVTVTTGSLTAVLSIIMLVLVVVFPTTLHFVMFDYPLGSIYFSTLLANLNSRNFVRGSSVANNVSQQESTIPLQRICKSQPSSSLCHTVENSRVTPHLNEDGLSFDHSKV